MNVNDYLVDISNAPNSPGTLVFLIGVTDDAEVDGVGWRARAKAFPVPGNPGRWVLAMLMTRHGFERQGHGRAMINAIRVWAGQVAAHVTTAGAIPAAHGFYERTGCQWDPDSQEWVVADPRRPGSVPRDNG